MYAAMGHADVATRFLDEAEALIDALPAPNGAASPIKPVHELYGELLFDLGRPAEAAEKFQRSLALMPNRPRSLLGLARAALATGDRARAAEAYETLAELWAGREGRPEMIEARRFWRAELAGEDARGSAMNRARGGL
jgi:hypothetical protein